MRNIIYSLILLLLIASCNSWEKAYKPRYLKFDKIDLSPTSDWILIHSDFYDKIKIIDDYDLIKQHLNDFSVYVDRQCLGTTPDFEFSLYKDGERVDQILYCGWNIVSLKFGGLKKGFKTAQKIELDFKNKTQWKNAYDSISNLDKTFFVFKPDTSIFANGYFTIGQIKDSTDLDYMETLDYEKVLEKEFSQLFDSSIYRPKANAHGFSPDGVTTINIKVRCNKTDYKKNEINKLNNSDKFKGSKLYEYEFDSYDFTYLTWK